MGKITMKLLKAGIFTHHKIMGYVDNNSHKKSEIQKIGGVKLIPAEAADCIDEIDYVFITASKKNVKQEIYESAKKAQIPDEKILFCLTRI